MTAPPPVTAPPAAEPAPAVDSDQEEAVRAEPEPEASLELLADGRGHFERACGSCHPQGQRDIGPAIAGRSMSVQDMRTQIREGSGRMRPIPQHRLSEAQVPALMAYLRSIGAVQKMDEGDVDEAPPQNRALPSEANAQVQ